MHNRYNSVALLQSIIGTSLAIRTFKSGSNLRKGKDDFH